LTVWVEGPEVGIVTVMSTIGAGVVSKIDLMQGSMILTRKLFMTVAVSRTAVRVIEY
jgi:hypothetical protein